MSHSIAAAEQDIVNRLPHPPFHREMIPMPPSHPCVWEEDEDGIWAASCDPSGQNYFVFNEDGPEANRFEFCPYCGRPLIEVKPAE